MAGMDPKRRKFLKHLGLLGFGALIGLGITQATSPSEAKLIEDYSNAELKSGRKLVWKDEAEARTLLDPPKRYEVSTGGKPNVRINVCAYHIDDNGDGEYEPGEEGNYCSMPCRAICPVDAISIIELTDEQNSFKGKKVPEVDTDTCIGCTKCFRICGYNAIQWFNK